MKHEIDYNKIEVWSKHMESIFCGVENYKTTAYLNWGLHNSLSMEEQLFYMSKEYFQAADLVLTTCIEDNGDKKADKLCLPCMFLINHGIELSLKAINTYLCYLLQEENDKLCHNLQNLVMSTINRLNRLKDSYVNMFGAKEFDKYIIGIELVKNFIDNIYENTQDMSFTRYPFDKEYDPMYYLLDDDCKTVNMELLDEQFNYVRDMLDKTFCFIDEIKSSAKAELS